MPKEKNTDPGLWKRVEVCGARGAQGGLLVKVGVKEIGFYPEKMNDVPGRGNSTCNMEAICIGEDGQNVLSLGSWQERKSVDGSDAVKRDKQGTEPATAGGACPRTGISS